MSGKGRPSYSATRPVFTETYTKASVEITPETGSAFLNNDSYFEMTIQPPGSIPADSPATVFNNFVKFLTPNDFKRIACRESSPVNRHARPQIQHRNHNDAAVCTFSHARHFPFSSV